MKYHYVDHIGINFGRTHSSISSFRTHVSVCLIIVLDRQYIFQSISEGLWVLMSIGLVYGA
jgi:hypothetical protein